MIIKNGKKKLLSLDSLREVRATIGIYQLRKYLSEENKYESLLESLKKYGRKDGNK